MVARPASEPAPSFETLYEEHVDFVWRYAATHGIAPAQLDDVVQEVFLVVHARLASFERRSGVKTWIAGIAVNVVRGFRRRRRNRQLGEPIEELESFRSPEGTACDALELKRTLQLLDRALAQMAELPREAFVLCDLEQLPQVEVAAMLGVNENTLRARLRTARLIVKEVAGSAAPGGGSP
ncbi:MAG TPA: sigma-70 family RNA polymerase sigma factor [Polyangiaceae bacterium]|nr:sigma-70 family RNA polymerase sigma factor [Polyangiaceae bacterium]